MSIAILSRDLWDFGLFSGDPGWANFFCKRKGSRRNITILVYHFTFVQIRGIMDSLGFMQDDKPQLYTLTPIKESLNTTISARLPIRLRGLDDDDSCCLRSTTRRSTQLYYSTLNGTEQWPRLILNTVTPIKESPTCLLTQHHNFCVAIPPVEQCWPQPCVPTIAPPQAPWDPSSSCSCTSAS